MEKLDLKKVINLENLEKLKVLSIQLLQNNIKQSKVFHKDKNTYTVIVDVENAIEEIKGIIFARSGDSAKNLVEVELKLDSVKNVSSGEELKIVNDKKIIFENLTKGIHEFEFSNLKK